MFASGLSINFCLSHNHYSGHKVINRAKGYPAGLCWLSSRALWLSSRAQGCFVEPCWITSRALWLSNRAQGCFVEGKGSRQNRSVTLGKGLDLRVGYRGPCSKAVAKQTLLDAPK